MRFKSLETSIGGFILKILIYADTYFPTYVGGGEIFLDKLTKELVKRGFDFLLITNKLEQNVKRSERDNGLTILRVPPESFYIPKSLLKKAFFQIKKLIREILKFFVFFIQFLNYKPHIFFINGPTITVLPSILPISSKIKAWKLIKRIFSPFTVVICHALTRPYGSFLEQDLSDFREADILVYVDKWMEPYLKNIPKIWIPNGVDTNLFSPSPLQYSHKILSVGRLCHDRGTDLLLNAIPNLVKRFPDIKVQLIGWGDLQIYKKIVKNLKISDNVEFMGKIPNEELIDYYRDAYIVVNAARVRGIHIATLEAMACGRACIKSYYKPDHKIIEDLKNGFLFNGEDVAELVNKIEFSFDNYNLVKKISAKAREKAEKFSFTTNALKYENLFNKIAKYILKNEKVSHFSEN